MVNVVIILQVLVLYFLVPPVPPQSKKLGGPVPPLPPASCTHELWDLVVQPQACAQCGLKPVLKWRAWWDLWPQAWALIGSMVTSLHGLSVVHGEPGHSVSSNGEPGEEIV